MFDIDQESTAELESNGVWANFRGAKFLIAHMNNISFQRHFNRLQQPHSKKIAKGSLDPKIQLDIMCEAMAGSLLLNWENVGSKGELISFSKEMAKNVLINNSELREFITDYSTDLENFRDEEIEEEGKS